MNKFLVIALGSFLISATIIEGNNGCFWVGTSPFCHGKCETGFVTTKVDSKGDGTSCLTGTKSLCCPEGTAPADSRNDDRGGCYWAGTSPLCRASCTKDFFVKKHSDTGDGKKCLFGIKKFCCPDSQQE